MEVMEEGNLMDRVPILLQRDMQYYEQHQTVLQEIICPGVVGGTLDFPRSASFAAVKIVDWWEDEYYAAYKKNSGLLHLNEDIDGAMEKVIVKASDPEKFVSAITKSAEKLLGHIHTLSQEALDHADLAVLTATIGASALIKNCLWVYLRSVSLNMCRPKGDESGGSLKISYKQYSEMTEALAERLLDLHVRLLSLYIIQDADCLHWENQHPFFESERGSYVIQMWWLYMQGVKQDLWNSVPPNMAKRVFAGILNETLTILTARYAQIIPSQARSQLLLVDISNLLFCVAEILPAICENGEAYAGLNITNHSKVVRDIHCKCQELFLILILRGSPLGTLFKAARKGSSGLQLFATRTDLISPWILFALPKIFRSTDTNCWTTKLSDFSKNTAIALELKVLLNSPQANWSLLLKILLMRDSNVSSIIFGHLIKFLPLTDCFKSALEQPLFSETKDKSKCDGFLCGKECNPATGEIKMDHDPIGQRNYQIVFSLTYVILLAGKSSDIKLSLILQLEKNGVGDWSSCLDKRQVWNQKRPPWFEAINQLVYPILDPIIHMLISAIQTGASIYQTMALAISSFMEMWDCIPHCLYNVTSALGEIICTDVRPLGESVLIQVLFSALYTKLLETARKWGPAEEHRSSDPQQPQTPSSMSKSAICTMLAEAICSVDEDNKHTEAIHALIKQAKERQSSTGDTMKLMDDTLLDDSMPQALGPAIEPAASPSTTQTGEEYNVESTDYMTDVIASDVLNTSIGKQSMKLLYNYLKFNAEWLLQQLHVSNTHTNECESLPGQKISEDKETLLQLMFHIGRESFDQLLSGSLSIDYATWLQTPMAVTPERAWTQISQRYEFQDNANISMQDSLMVAFITSKLKT